MINSAVRLRLVALGLAVGLMGALIVLVTLNSERQAVDVRRRLGQVDIESFQIADRFKDTLRHANDRMRHYASANDPAAWNEFLQASEELAAWIGRQTPKTTTERESATLEQMRAACDLFLVLTWLVPLREPSIRPRARYIQPPLDSKTRSSLG